MYGDGCFETLKSYAGRFLDFDAHFQRLLDAFEYLGIDFVLSRDELLLTIKSVLEANNIENEEGMVRFQCWRTGGRGYKINNRNCDWLITTERINTKTYAPSRLISADTPVIPSKALKRNVKLSNGLNYITAAKEAYQKNVDDAVMCTMDGFVSETTIANIFWGKENLIYTPSEDCDLLPGVTRKIVLQAIEKSEFQIKQGRFSLDDLKSAEYAFTTNSISEIRPILQLDGVHFDPKHPELIRVKSMFEALKNERLSDE